MSKSVDFDALEASMREVPSVPLRERAAIAWRGACAPHEARFQMVAAALLDEVLGVGLAEAQSVVTTVQDLEGNGLVEMTVDGVSFKVTLDSEKDPVLKVQVGSTWHAIRSLVELGYQLAEEMTAAHYQTVSINVRLREWVPEHEPREHDPHYSLFRAAKRKMRELDIPCWRCGVRYEGLVRKGDAPAKGNPLAAYQLEAHHNDCEFSLLNAIDVGKWWDSSTRQDGEFMVESFSNVDGWLAKHPEMVGKPHDDVFLAYMESEGNLQQLCDVCHRSKEQGIHHIPYPDWRVRAVWRDDLPDHIS